MSKRVENIICKHCGGLNIVYNTPYKRRDRVDKHLSVEEEVWNSLKTFCVPYGDMNNGIAMLLYEVQKIKAEENARNIRNIQVKNANE